MPDAILASSSIAPAQEPIIKSYKIVYPSNMLWIYCVWAGKIYMQGDSMTAAEQIGEEYTSVDMMTKKINTLLIEMNISKKELARRLNTSPSNLSGKLKRDNFTEKELRQIAALCGATFEACFVTDTGRRI